MPPCLELCKVPVHPWCRSAPSRAAAPKVRSIRMRKVGKALYSGTVKLIGKTLDDLPTATKGAVARRRCRPGSCPQGRRQRGRAG